MNIQLHMYMFFRLYTQSHVSSPSLITWRGPRRAASSQVIQDQSGAKSGNYLAEFVCVVSSFVFNFIFLAPVRGKQVFQSCSAERNCKQILELLGWSVYIL